MAITVSELCMGCMKPMGDGTVCTACGYDNAAPYDRNYCKPGSILSGRYLVGNLVRKNGEGAVYIGFDNNLQAKVWIREYFPHTLAERDVLTGSVRPLPGVGAQFKALMSDFVDICNDVKRMGVTEPVIPIENVVADHETVYAIYRDMGVVPLETWLNRSGGKLPVGEARDLLLPLLNTLSNIHARGVIHRGISPYTVYIDREGHLYLWDFCMSATRTGGSELDAELFTGYSAPEQYTASGWQGTWTDVYGAAALFYRVVSGFVPPKSTMVNSARPLAPLIDLVMDLPANISDAVSDAMNPSTDQRTQEIGPFLARLVHTELSSTAVYDVSMVNEVKKKREEKRSKKAEKRRRYRYVFLGLLITVALLSGTLFVIMKTFFPELMPDSSSSSSRRDTSGASMAETDEEEPEGQEPETPVVDKSMPNLVGMRLDAVENNSAYDRFRFTIQEEYNAQYDEGVIYDHSPGEGITVQDGRTVILYVSKGTRTYTMPNLTGMTLEEAQDALRMMVQDEMDFTVNVFTRYSDDENIDPGTVVDSSPATGQQFNPLESPIVTIWLKQETSVNEAATVQQPSSQEDDRRDNRRDNDRRD